MPSSARSLTRVAAVEEAVISTGATSVDSTMEISFRRKNSLTLCSLGNNHKDEEDQHSKDNKDNNSGEPMVKRKTSE